MNDDERLREEELQEALRNVWMRVDEALYRDNREYRFRRQRDIRESTRVALLVFALSHNYGNR